MKKLIGLVTIAVIAITSSFAQGIQDDIDRANNPRRNTPRAERQRTPQQQRVPQQRQQRELETVTVSGNLRLEKGFVAVQSGENTYLVPMLTRYIGFINGLQEGKTVSVEGYNFNRNDTKILHPQKLTIDDKNYDFNRGMFAQGFRNQPQRQQVMPRNNQRNMPQHRYYAPCCRHQQQRHHAPRKREQPRLEREPSGNRSKAQRY